MSLTSSLQIGRSGLSVSQLAIQTAGNNIANAATPGYSRQVVSLIPSSDQNVGSFFIGRGVQIGSIRRQVDTALQSRLQSSISQQSLAQSDLKLLSTVEATLNELSDNDTGSQLSAFFNAWSNLAEHPGDSAARSVVVQQGRTLAGHLRQSRQGLVEQRTQVDANLVSNVNQADSLLQRIADLNTTIVTADNASGNANSLRDQRDAVVVELAGLMDITTVEQANGGLDVLVGSTPIVLAGQSRGIQLRQTPNGTGISVDITTKDNNEVLNIQQGTLGSLLINRTALVDDTIDRLDTLSAQLIFQVNRVHSSGYGTTARTSATAARAVPVTDANLAFNDPANQTFAALPFQPQNGSFLIKVTNATTGASEDVRINVDLDGITAAGTPGFADDTDLTSLAAQIGAVSNLTATVNASGQLQINAASGYTMTFSEDSSGILATLGINTYFNGSSAADIAVTDEILQNPRPARVGTAHRRRSE